MNAPGKLVTAGIAIDSWKLPIFERHLSRAGYTFDKSDLLDGCLMLRVKTTNPIALGVVVRAANDEAAMSKGAKP